MACFPAPLLAWLPRRLQPDTSPSNNDGWDYGGKQTAPLDMLTGDTVKPYTSALHQVSSERNSHPQRVQGNPKLNQSFRLQDNGTLSDIQPPQQAARRSFSIRQPTSINFSRLFTRRHQSDIETKAHQSFGAPVFKDNANHPPSTHSVRSSVSGPTITLPNPSIPIELQIPQKVAQPRRSKSYTPNRHIPLDTDVFNPTAPLEKHRPRWSPRNYMAWCYTQCLTVDRLIAITSFERYECTIWDLRTVYIKFYVKYNDGSEGYVYGGPVIFGKTSSEAQLLYLRCKVITAKALLGDEEWSRLRQKYGVERDRTLELSRCMNLV